MRPANDNKDGGPPRGGEMIIGMSPDIIAGPNWQDHVEEFMQKITGLQGVRYQGSAGIKTVRTLDRVRSMPRFLIPLKVCSELKGLYTL